MRHLRTVIIAVLVLPSALAVPACNTVSGTNRSQLNLLSEAAKKN